MKKYIILSQGGLVYMDSGKHIKQNEIVSLTEEEAEHLKKSGVEIIEVEKTEDKKSVGK